MDKDPRFSLKEIFNNHIISLLNSSEGKKQFKVYINNAIKEIKEENLDYDEEEDQLKELRADIAMLRAKMEYYHPADLRRKMLKDKNLLNSKIKYMEKK